MKSTWTECRFVPSLGIVICGFLFLADPHPAFADKPSKQTRPALGNYLKKLGFGVIPLKRGEENHLYVEALLGGKTRLLGIDTGWTLTTLDKSVGKNLKMLREPGVRVEAPNPGKSDQPSIVLIDDLKLGSARFPNQPALVKPLHPIACDGFLGCDFFIRHFCMIDCRDCRLYVRSEELKAAAQDALERSLRQSGYRGAQLDPTAALALTCDAKINAEPVKLLVDTGSSFTVLNDKPAIRCHLNWGETGMRIQGVGRIGSTKIWGARLKSFEIDGVEMPLRRLNIGRAEMARWSIGEKKSALETIDGVLGADLLAVSGALIDFRHRKLWFVPAQPDSKSEKPLAKSR
jgi:hypothetical protein